MSRLPINVATKLIPIYEREYTELSQNWASVERKAQIVGGTVLALLTGGLALVAKSIASQPAFVVFALALLAIALSVAGYFSAQALNVSDETLPPPGEKIRAIAWEEKRDDIDVWTTEFEAEAMHQIVINWDQACKDLKTSVDKKGDSVAKAHCWLIISGCLSLAAFLWIAITRISEFIC